MFDLDGTLIDAYGAITVSFNHVMRTFGYPVQPASVVRRAVGWGDRKLLARFVATSDIDKALRLYRHHHAGTLPRLSRVYPGVRAVLRRLKRQGYSLAVASNRPTRFSRIVIKALGLSRYFDYVLCGDKVARMKPFPDILRAIMRKFKASPGECLFVGDMAIDALTGRRAKVTTVMVTTGSSSRREIQKHKPSFIINGITDLLQVPVLRGAYQDTEKRMRRRFRI